MENTTFVSAVLRNGELFPTKPALIFKKETVSYGELGMRVKNFASILAQKEIHSQDRVMISALSKPEYITALLAVQFLSATAVPIDKTAKPENVNAIFKSSQAALYLTDRTANLDGALPLLSLKDTYARSGNENFSESTLSCRESDGEAIAEILFTSGTTGVPKGVMLSNRAISSIIMHTWSGIGMREDDIILNALPLNHSFGMRVLRSALNGGATVVLQNGFSFAKEIETNINEHHCTGMICVPASMEVIYRQMREKLPEILGKLRYIEFGAGSLSYDMKKKLLREIPQTEIHNTWGSTETGGALFLNVTKYPEKLTSIGRCADDIEIRILKEDGNEATAADIDTAGRMVLKGDMHMSGYWNNPDETSKALQSGWIYTNDLVYRDEDGFIYMLGRADDIINVGGEKVSPLEVENIAQEYEDVRECACIGVKDPKGIMGQVPILYIVKEKEAFSEVNFSRFLAEKMERYKLPQKYC